MKTLTPLLSLPLLIAACLGAQQARAGAAARTHIDPQKVQDQDAMTWKEYHAIPGVDWADPKRVPARKNFKVALIAVDFPDQPFVITMRKNSDLFGNPQINPVARAKVAQ